MKVDRHWQMKQYLLERKAVTNKELCDNFNISIETVRRDLTTLEEEGVLRRVYGGAVLADDNIMPELMQPWATRYQQNQAEKAAIAQEVLKYIPNNATIALDSGTTIFSIAQLLKQRSNLTIITNCMRSALEISLNSTHNIYCVGGLLKKDEVITTGFFAVDFLNYFSRIDLAIIGADGLDTDKGVTDFSVEMGMLKRIMVEKADKVILATDNSKFASNALYKSCSIEDIDIVITDAGTSAENVKALRHRGIEVMQVHP
ncbi:DeoR/GlpR family DNA-binding transcription regulator [Bacillota bacterium Meth-B3]|nr:DeoR/GlpR family DNA-binding transcription regulator [Christensenellaceae bacterium]